MTPAKEAAAILKRLREKKEEILERTVREEEEITAERLKEWKAKAARTEEEIAAKTKEEEEWKKRRISKKSSMRLDIYSYDGRVSRDVILEEFEVDELCVVESITIRELILEDQLRMHHTNIHSRVLKKVMDFCKERAMVKCSGMHLDDDDKGQELLKEFDDKYLQELSSTHRRFLSKILRAACELKVTSLADLTSTAILNMVGDKDTPAILKMFHFNQQSISLREMKRGMKELQYWDRLKQFK